MLLSLPMKHTGFHWTLAPGSRSTMKQDFMHWSKDLLQVALCPMRVQSHQREKNVSGFPPLSEDSMCVFQGKGLHLLQSLHKASWVPIPTAAALPVAVCCLPISLDFFQHPENWIWSTDPFPLQLSQRMVPEAAVNTISSSGGRFLLTTSSQIHLVMLCSFLCLPSLPDALLESFPPEDGSPLQRAWGHKNTFVLVMQSHLLTHDCTTQKHPPHPNALLAAAAFSWCLIVLCAGEVHGNSSVPNCFLQQLQTQHIISRQVHITTRPPHVRFPSQKRNRKSLL